MIIVNLKGGLGNQMFQYATGRVLALKNKDTLKLDIAGLTNTSWMDAKRSFKLGHFNIDASVGDENEYIKYKYPYGLLSKAMHFSSRKVFRQFHIGYEAHILNKTGNVYLDGYFQSELYFKEYRDVLLGDFTLKETPSEAFMRVKEKINKKPSVAIHIRRGDYASDLKTKVIWSIVDLEYYKKALSYLEEKIGDFNLFVFSNDSDWVRNTMTFTQKTFYVSDIGCPDYEELMLMSKCSYTIIANSTFSWWGAWLNQNSEKIVIAPQRWTRRHSRQHKHIIPETWIQM